MGAVVLSLLLQTESFFICAHDEQITERDNAQQTNEGKQLTRVFLNRFYYFEYYSEEGSWEVD